MTNLPLKIYHHNLKKKYLLGDIINVIEYTLEESHYTVGQLVGHTFGIRDNGLIIKIGVSIYRRKTHWTLYIKECEN